MAERAEAGTLILPIPARQLQRWTINGELRDEENDPRFLWTYSGLRRHKNPALTLYPASFDASSVSLDVTYTGDEDDPCVLSIV